MKRLEIEGVAELLKIDKSSVTNLGRSGKLQVYSLGGRRYYKRNEFEAALIKVK
ncbi:MAG: helix-turn-helix domain-containing protein [Arenibacter algicola]